MTALLDDVRHCGAALRRRLGLVIVAVPTLGLGIGASTTLYTTFLPFLCEMPPVADPDRLAVLLKINPALGIERGRLPFGEFLDWREDASSFDALAAIAEGETTLGAHGVARRVSSHRVTAEFFDTVGVSPALGRAFRPEEAAPGARPVAIISHALWRGMFQQDPDILGRAIDLSDEPHIVVGVMPEAFWFVVQGVDVWTPLPLDRGLSVARTSVLVVGRRRPEVAWQQAQSEVDALTRRVAPASDTAAGWRTSVAPLNKEATKRTRPMATAFMPALLVLLIGCVNVANLLLANAVAREHEVAVRTAIGATRPRLARQLLIESAWLALGGGVAGLLFTFVGVEIFRAVLGRSQPLAAARIVITPSAFAFALVLTVLTPLVFGLVPALRASSPNLGALLKDGPRGDG